MELDDYLSQLNNDLQGQIDRLSQTIVSSLQTHISFCPECGTRLEGEVNFCPNCGTRISEAPSEDIVVSSNSQEPALTGILLTDTMVLAEKYDCEQSDVKALLHKVVEECAKHNIRWYLLDADDYAPDDLWIDYNDCISDFMEANKIPYGIKTPVFIIGGDDVIPIPLVEDPFGSSDNGRIPCDMCYAFRGNYFSDLWDGDRSVEESHVRNTVSRLPLEDGPMQSSIENDILGYFSECIPYYDKGIAVDGVMMTANASWLPASTTMSEHLPLVNHDDVEEVTYNDMYVCPPVSPDNSSSMKCVKQTLKEVGMLLFNLHGTDCKGMSGFYSDGGEAFNMKELEYCADAKVFNTVACFGARYSGYDRKDSMVLTALHDKKFLLYAGSLIPVPMTELDVPEGVEVHEGSGSEHLMPIFCMEQYSGKPMGEAMMKAKLEYFNTFRHMERDDFSLATMMMFSLYGNPMLRMQRNEKVLEMSRQMHVLPEIPSATKLLASPVRMKKTQRLWGKSSASGALLDEIRSAVDSGLNALQQGISEGLYEYLGLEPRWLDHIDFYEYPMGDGTLETGYIYAYNDKSKQFGGKTWVEVDNEGKPRRKYTTK